MSVDCGWFVLPAHESRSYGLDDGLVRSTLHVYIANMTMLVDLHGADYLSMPAGDRWFDGVNSNWLSEALIFSLGRVDRLHSRERENPFADISRRLQRVDRDFYFAGTAPDDRQFAGDVFFSKRLQIIENRNSRIVVGASQKCSLVLNEI